jgi:heat-inducible transcriptional repressor
MEISERKKKILVTIVEEYIKNFQAVSSSSLVEKCKLDVSSATVRNEMAELEEEGYIFQPHTSAGRIPTELAYSFFVDNLDGEKISSRNIKGLDDVFDYSEKAFKLTAKKIAEISKNAVFWAFHKNDLYYTGISNLFFQPEFKESNLACDVSVVIDRMEEIISDIFEDLEEKENIFIGSENPFGQFLSSIILKYKKDNVEGVVGILGPTRMDYKKNIDIINYLKSKF